MLSKKPNQIIILAIKLTGILILLLFASKPISAQWFAGIQAGYVSPRNMGESSLHFNRTIEKDYYHDTDPQITKENIYFNVWESFSYGISGGYRMNKLEFNLAVLFTSNTSNQQLPNNTIETVYTQYNPLNDNTIVQNEYREFYNQSLILSPGVKYNFRLDNFIISPFAFFSFQFTQLIEHNSRFYETDLYYLHSEEAVYREYKYKPELKIADIFNPESGISIEYMFSQHFSAYINSSITLLKKNIT
ncbi:MAG: hypothetical protein R6V32_06230, partial [Bacteroidales bacterium]